MLGLLTDDGPKTASLDIMGELTEEDVERAGEAAGDAPSLRMEDVPREGDFQRYFSANEGPRRN
jgi:hypothetical protein